MTTALLAALAAVATVIARLWWGRRVDQKARREAEAARAAEEVKRRQAEGRAATERANREAAERVDEQQARAREVGRERATDPAVVNAPTPEKMVEAAWDGLRRTRRP